MSRYSEAKEIYAKIGVDTDKALEKLKNITVSMHCWQGDDVVGFDSKESLSGGIQTTGNYPGKANTPEQLMQDIDKVISLTPGKLKLNLHACYAIFPDGEFRDRDKIQPKDFKKWVDFAKERKMGIDFNPTFFSHPRVKDNLTLSSPDEETRKFWIEHGKRCIEISQYFAEETGIPCVMNIWIPDGYKDIPADRYSPRARFKASLDEILSTPYDKSKVFVTLESKVFGIGLESYTVGSAEFCMNYVNSKKIVPLMDNGHYHPTEVVSDKVSSMLLFNEKIALHITRSVRWDSDHVVIFDDETKEIMKEIVRNDALDRVFIATDYFDASINRVSAWITGLRSVEKALLYALLEPSQKMKALQNENDFTSILALGEEIKTMPFGDVWNEYLSRENKKSDYLSEIKEYEKSIGEQIMKNIFDAPFVKEMGSITANMYRLGWDERNGGNLSYLLDENEVYEYLDKNNVIRTIPTGFQADALIGKVFIVTGTGKYYKNIENDPETNLGIIRIAEDGTTAELLWGYKDGGKFTSELPAHLMSHMARLSVDPENRVVMHCHPTNTLAMNFVHELDEKSFTHSLWEMCTECIVVFPEGIGVLPWMLCGTNSIGEATAEKMKEFRLVVWGLHGIYGVGKTLDEAFGLIETVEKAAQIYMLTAGLPRVNTISDAQMKELAEYFGVNYRKDFLNL